MFKNLFSKSNEEKMVTINSPLKGQIMKMEDVPDQVFSQKLMGDGFAINPSVGEIYAPIDAEVVSLFPTGHAIGLKTADEVEILIHFGIDTVNLKGEGFTAKVAVGDKVLSGDILLEIDIESVKDKVPSLITPVIFTKVDPYTLPDLTELYGKDVLEKEELFNLVK